MYAIIDDYLDIPWVFIVEPPRVHDVEKPVALIAPVSWEEEVYYLRKIDVRCTRYTISTYINLGFIIVNHIFILKLYFL